jgi:energy-coupling factor transporter ATP-binding protein EcfA2
MKLSDAYDIVKTNISLQNPVMLWGPPGIGKSSLIHQIAKELKLGVIDLRLAQLEPTDLRGVPMPNRETGRADWYLPAFWPTAATEDTTRKVKNEDGTFSTVAVKEGCCVIGPGIVFLDEIEKAPVSVKNASLQLVLDRMVGSYKLPDDWTIVCAGNREEDGCFSQPLGAALSNRMCHLDIEPDIDAWGKWARDNGVLEDVIAYLHFAPSSLYKQTEEHAFPSPRSWVMASKLIQSVKQHRDQKELMTSAIGRGTTSEYTVWNNVYRTVNPESIFEGNMPDFSNAKDQSFKYAVALACAFYLRKRKGGIKKIEEHIAKFLQLCPVELRVVFLKQQSLQTMEQMAKSPAFVSMIKEIMKIAV